MERSSQRPRRTVVNNGDLDPADFEITVAPVAKGIVVGEGSL
jgi:hypothetical protein